MEVENTKNSNADKHTRTWRWLVLTSCFMIQFLVYGNAQSFGILYPEIVDFYGGGKGATAWIGSILSSMILLIGPLASILTQKFGYRMISIFGAVLTSTGLLSSMLVQNIYILYLTFGVMTGSGSGLLVISSILAVTDYFPNGQGMAVGIVCSGGGIGLTIYPLIYRILLDEYGWRMSLLIQAAIFFNGIACGMVLKPTSRKLSTTDRSVYGIKILRQGSVWLYIVSAVINSFAFYIPLFYLPAHASSLQISGTDGAFLISLHGITSVFSRILFGWIADRPKVNVPFLFSILPIIEGAVIACIPSMKFYWMLVIASIINGTTGTVFVSMATAVLVKVVGVNNLPSAFGYWCFSNGIGILTGPPLAGWFFDLTGSYVPAFYLSSALFIISGFLMMIWPIIKHYKGTSSMTSKNMELTYTVAESEKLVDSVSRM